MKINYRLNEDIYSYTQENQAEVNKLNFLLTNVKGDFLNLGVGPNSTKYQGLNMCNTKTLEIFKFLDEIILPNLEVKSVEYGGYYVKREFGSKISEVIRTEILNTNAKSEFDDDAKLVYNDNGVLEEVYSEETETQPYDYFYLGPTGGMVYQIFNYDGDLLIDLDIRKQNDFDVWGREYNVYQKDGIIFVEYSKKVAEKEDYKVIFGIKAVNFIYDLKKEWLKKEYEYSKQRNSLSERYIYRLMSVSVSESKRLLLGYGFTEEEVKTQIELLEQNQNDLEEFDKEIYNEFVKDKDFQNPIPQDFLVAYKLSNNGLYRFLNKFLRHKNISSGSFAGLPWFSNIWARDELIGLRAFINNSEEAYVKEKLFDYLSSIDTESGMLKRIDEEGAYQSADGVFWLAKRFEDFIYHLEKKGRLSNVLTQGELNIVYEKMYNSFEKIVANNWDSENELLKVKKGDSWMDTIDLEYPFDMQVLFLEFVSFLVIAAQILKREEINHLSEFESLLKNKIRDTYLRNGILYNEAFKDKINSNAFLAYYIYPDLFSFDDWEIIFDNVLPHLKTSWGGISSLSRKDSEFKENYTGENNLSYHRGDSWYWINNITAIVLNDLNEKKYRPYISKILMSSTRDILKLGAIGFGSEISSASSQKAEGCFAQLWSSSTYIEMIDKIFGKYEEE